MRLYLLMYCVCFVAFVFVAGSGLLVGLACLWDVCWCACMCVCVFACVVCVGCVFCVCCVCVVGVLVCCCFGVLVAA